MKKRKSLNDLSKNIMSVLLPYLEHNEILRFEQTSKKMMVQGHYWPVWKNIYTEQHLKNQKLPKEVKHMNEDESL